MKNKIFKFLGFLFLMMVVVNLILSVISTFLPVKFESPSSVVEAPHYFNFVLGGLKFSLSQTVVNTWVLMLIIMFIVGAGTKKASVENPSKMQIVMEEYYHFIENTFLTTFGKHKKTYVPFFSALFAFIMFSNLSTFLFPYIMMVVNEDGVKMVKPFFRTPTADPNTTIGLSLVVIVLFLAVSIKQKGLRGYIKSLFEPMWFMFPLNIVDIFSKVLNTSMRLFGNMLAGLVIVGLLYSLVGRGLLQSLTHDMLKGSFSFSVGWPMIIQLYLDLFIGIVQAFVFTILSSVYISEALGEEE
jgi:ATP synthase F0, A subunit